MKKVVEAVVYLVGRVGGAALVLLFVILALGGIGIATDHQQLMGLFALGILGIVMWRTPAAFRNRPR
jgi:hypothetical protein